MELVYEIPGGAPDGPVDRDGVPHRVLNHVHPRLLQILAQTLDVVAHQPVMGIDRGAVVEEVQRTFHIEVQHLGYTVRLRDMLGLQRFHKSSELFSPSPLVLRIRAFTSFKISFSLRMYARGLYRMDFLKLMRFRLLMRYPFRSSRAPTSFRMVPLGSVTA